MELSRLSHHSSSLMLLLFIYVFSCGEVIFTAQLVQSSGKITCRMSGSEGGFCAHLLLGELGFPRWTSHQRARGRGPFLQLLWCLAPSQVVLRWSWILAWKGPKRPIPAGWALSCGESARGAEPGARSLVLDLTAGLPRSPNALRRRT